MFPTCHPVLFTWPDTPVNPGAKVIASTGLAAVAVLGTELLEQGDGFRDWTDA